MSFEAIKPHCVAFLQHVRLQDDSNLTALPRILEAFSSALESNGILSTQVKHIPAHRASYIFFPFSQFLQLNSVKLLRSSPEHQSIFCNVLRCLSLFVKLYDLEKGIREQLWTFGILTVGGPLGSKGVEQTWNADIQKATLLVLNAILCEESKASNLEIPLPILAHTINTLLLLIESEEHDTILAALQTLQLVNTRYLYSKDAIPQFLPGMVSTLCKITLRNKGNSKITIAVLACLQVVIEGAMSEERSLRLGLLDSSSQGHLATSLEEIFNSPAGTTGNTVTMNKSTSSNLPGMSVTWLRATASQLHRALVSLLPVIQSHENALVRSAFSSFSFHLLRTCQKSISHVSSRLLLEELLILSSDDWESVSRITHGYIDQLSELKPSLRDLVSKVAEDSILSLPHSILSYGVASESSLHRQFKLVITAFSRTPIISFSDLKVEKWSRTLLKALELVPVSNSAASSGGQDLTSAWMQSNQTILLIDDGHTAVNSEPKNKLPSFPSMKFVQLAPGKSVHLLQHAIRSVASATALGGSTSLLDHFLSFTDNAEPGSLNRSAAASGLWVTAQIMQGYADKRSHLGEGRIKRLCKDVICVAMYWLDNAEEANNTKALTSPILSEASTDLLAEGSLLLKGTTQLESLLGPNVRSSAIVSTKKLIPPSYRVHVESLSLLLLCESACLLGVSFRPHLLHSLYPLLRALSSPSTHSKGLVPAYAFCAIQHIAFYTSYPSPAQMIIQNVDYILNSVSAHLRGSTEFHVGSLDPLAPSVLVCVVDLAGNDVLSHLGDAVDEIFDALDRWHAYDLLVSELLRVLDKLVSVVSIEQRQNNEDVQSAMTSTLQSSPHSERDLLGFMDWFASTRSQPSEISGQVNNVQAIDTLLESNPGLPFEKLSNSTSDHEVEQEQDEEEDKPINVDDIPITRPQKLVLSILHKALYFLTHSSPFLRARVLSLLTSCVPVLQARSSDLLPEIHRFWPYILARLDDGFEKSPAYVLLECMKLIMALMEFKGDFMNLRIVKDVWPRLQILVSMFQPSHRRGKEDQFSDPYRVIRLIIKTMQMAIVNVPGIKNEHLWEIAMLFRLVLVGDFNAELRSEASELFRKLAKIEPDMVWLVLRSSLGQIEEMGFMRSEGLDEKELASILSSQGSE